MPETPRKRRTFLMASATSLVMPMAAQAYSLVEYSPATWVDLKQTDQTVILNFRATWSHTCNEKLELIVRLMAENSAYNNLSFVNVDWDTFGQSQFADRLRVTRHSTLIVMKQGSEITRVVNEPYERKIRAFLDTALSA